MPRYDYLCDANNRILEVTHGINGKVETWGELCEIVEEDPGGTPLDSPVHKVIMTPPMANTPKGNSYLKNQGFTKLVKRSDGTYENVTRTGTEKRFLDPKDPSSMPHLHKKISD
ncbi:MAG: hypothetical protein VB957_04885 [Pseudomonadales bacterium]